MTVTNTLKNGYVVSARGLAAASGQIGLRRWLEARGETSRLAHWMLSLGAIHDLEALVALDVPWWSYDAIDAVERFLRERPGARVFEYGSGASTLWLARRAGSVTSVEHHRGWYDRMQDALGRFPIACPVDLRLVAPDAAPSSDSLYLSEKSGSAGVSFSAYAREIDAGADALYDLIVIDGRSRNACLAHAERHLAEGGMIVFDNSGRTRYRRAIAQSGLSARRLRGLTPALPYPDETTLLTRPAGRE
ncbi:class I SAM-dependent methyltransferase [Salipiger mucosus]|uniref:SAM-dependent methyltransferase n=1 Tax=Salipiger mucosus DSM 16094 TaxID=1123237 RepID=S9QBM5_9RHOB|nr:class I SAM-dependent methyltransferase [Salipiger mucosus]EPX78816.1 hypothetical protein Salmuc_04399 [Salipiger mucosus DSM 16094]